MKVGRIFFILAALTIVIVAGFFAWQLFLKPMLNPTDITTPEQTQAVDTIDIVMVAQPMTRGQEFDESVLMLVPIQRSFYNDTMFTSIGAVVGKSALVDLASGTPLTSGMILDESNYQSGSDWSLMIPRGMVAVSIPINRLSSISYAPQRGDHVNVIVTLLLVDLDLNFQSTLPNVSAGVIGPGGSVLLGPIESEAGNTQPNLTSSDMLTTLANQTVSGSSAAPIGVSVMDPAFSQPFYVVPSESQRPRQVSQTLIQNAVVLQMGTFETDADRAAEAALAGAQPTEPQATAAPAPVVQQPDVITLIVTPQDAVALHYLVFSGARLTLVGRSSADDSLIDTESVTLQFLLDQYNITLPAKLPYGQTPRNDTADYPVLENDQVPATPEP
jgi:pilus assembly protein CpaB